MSDLLGVLAVVVIGAAVIWLAFRIEPHWVSRDGQRFICRGQLIDGHGNTHGGWNEYRFRVTPEGEVVANRRAIVGSRRSGSGTWRVAARSDTTKRGKAVFLLQPVGDTPSVTASMLAIRLPVRSRAVDTLERLIG